MTSIVATNDLLAINFKTRNQIKISSLTKDKIQQLKHLLDALLVDDFETYQTSFQEFSRSSSTKSNFPIEKPLKNDKMKTIPKIVENNENSHVKNVVSPANNVEKKKNTLQSAANFYSNSEHDESTRKRTNENESSPYFFNRFKRNLSNGETRPLATIHSKPLLNRSRLWDDEKSVFHWKDVSTSNSSTNTLRKKGLRNIGATCYMNSILQCLLNIDPFRYDLMVTNVDLISSSLLSENSIYFCILQILSLLQDRQSNQSQSQSTSNNTQLTFDERTAESQALSNLKKAVEKHSGHFFGSRQQGFA